MIFENSNSSAISGSAADEEWNSFMPSNNGFIAHRIENNTVFLSISAFHAMHCLNSVRRVLEVNYDVASAETTDEVENDLVLSSYYHMHHCLIYLRDMVVCNADPALEHDILREDGTKIMVGDGTKHTCRDFKALQAISEEDGLAAKTGCGA